MQRGHGRFEAREGEVLRYLGHCGQAVDDELAARIESVRAQAAEQIQCRWVWETWPVEHAGDGIGLAGSGVTLPGASIAEHLSGATQAALLCATAGSTPDLKTRTLQRREPVAALVWDACGIDAIAEHLSGATQAALLCATAGSTPDLKTRTLQRREPVAALVWDACGIDAVELAADAAGAEVAAFAAEQGLVTGWRFSPGYGDLPLAVQPAVLAALDAERTVGVTLTDHLLMVPMKSVTAVVGLFSADAAPNDSVRSRCDDCSIRDACSLRAAGTPCWRKRDTHAEH